MHLYIYKATNYNLLLNKTFLNQKIVQKGNKTAKHIYIYIYIYIYQNKYFEISFFIESSA